MTNQPDQVLHWITKTLGTLEIEWPSFVQKASEIIPTSDKQRLGLLLKAMTSDSESVGVEELR